MSQKKFCSCKDSSKVYCIIDSKRNTLHRATFSKSLAEHIISITEGYDLKEAYFIRGRRLEPGQESRGLYGIVATQKDLVLRIPLTKELAAIYADDDSRHIEEIFLQFDKEESCPANMGNSPTHSRRENICTI